MNYKNINIGLVIEQKVNELGLSKSEFARKIGIPSQNVNRIFEKSSIDTDKLIIISKALGCDFFSFYHPDGGTVQTSGDYSPASLNGNAEVSIGTNNKEEISLLKKLLEEKERTIQILLNKTNTLKNSNN